MNLLSSPAVILSAAVTILAALFCLAAAMNVARKRRAHGIEVPAMSGHPEVERALRVQGNTVEQFVIFLPALWLATLYFQGWIPPVIGLIWVIGRVIFLVGYMASADKRHIGFGITVLSNIALLILATIGVVNAWTVVG